MMPTRTRRRARPQARLRPHARTRGRIACLAYFKNRADQREMMGHYTSSFVYFPRRRLWLHFYHIWH